MNNPTTANGTISALRAILLKLADLPTLIGVAS